MSTSGAGAQALSEFSSEHMACRECGCRTFAILRSGDVVCAAAACRAVYGMLRDRRRADRRRWG